MMKNLVILVVFAWVGFTYATPEVAHEDMKDVESYKVEKPVEEMKRGVAGGKQKRPAKKEETSESESDSEVRYWQYSE